MKLFGRRRSEAELAAEFELHLEQLMRQHMAAGMSEHEARLAARRDFGAASLFAEQCRDARGASWLEDLARDTAHAGRLWSKSPGFALAAIATLTLGIGAAVLMFAVLYSVVLRPLPYREPGRLVFLWINDAKRGINEEGTSYPTYLDWRAQTRTFETLSVRGRGYSMKLGGAEPERLMADVVSAPFFEVLGIGPQAGRVFTTEDEDRGELAAVISHGFAVRRFGSPTAAIGQPIELDRRLWRIIGVMPPRYGIPPYRQDLWVPARKFPSLERYMTERDKDFFMGIARLRPGVSIAQAQAEMDTVAASLEKAYPIADADFGGYRTAVVPMDRQVLGLGLPRALRLLMGAVSLVLLVACLNIANLLLARGERRRDEMAIRAALGAPAGRLIRQQIAESLWLAALGGLAGIGFARLGLKVLPVLAPAALPRFDELALHPPVILFAVAAGLAACGLFALVPAWIAARRPGLAGSSARIANAAPHRLQPALVIAEFALSLVLLSGAGLFLRSLWAVESSDAGFDAKNLMRFQVNSEKPAAFTRELLARLESLPGVKAAGAIGSFFYDRNADYSVTVQGRPTEAHEQVTVDGVSPRFLEAAGARLLKGRHLEDADYRERPGAVVINETFAARFFPNEEPVGKHFKFGTAEARGPWIEVAGVVADLKRRGLERHAVCEAFGPVMSGSMDIVVRSSIPPASLAAAVRETVRSLDPAALADGVTTMQARLDEFAAERRLQTWLLSAFSILTLLLSAVGAFGVMQYLVSARRKEIAIRAAMGATGAMIRRSVLRQGLGQALVGIAAGWMAAIALAPVTAPLLYGVRPFDATAFVTASLVLGVAAFAACWIPAASAARANPAALLRE